MSITVLSSPSDASGQPTAQDSLWHVCISDNSGQVDFKYVFDVFVGDTQKIRVKLYPDPANGNGYFDAGPTVRNEFTYEWFQPITDNVFCCEPSASGEIKLAYNIRIGEDYSGVTTLNMASGNITAYNFLPPLFKRKVYDFRYKNDSWLSNRTLNINADVEDNIFIGIKKTGNLRVHVDTYDGTNTLISAYEDASGSTFAVTEVAQLNIGGAAINARLGVNAINEGVKFYEIYIFDALGDTAPVRVNLECGRYTPVPLHFLNAWGVWDTAKFGLVSSLTMNVERKSYTKEGTARGSTVEYYNSNNKYYESKINYSNKNDWEYALTMDSVSDADYEWLAELISSSQILAEIDGYFYPVTIKKNNYKYFKYEVDRLKALDVTIEMNQTRYSHLR